MGVFGMEEERIGSWWGRSISENVRENCINVFSKYLSCTYMNPLNNNERQHII